MNRIFKYVLLSERGEQALKIPVGNKFLSAEVQHGKITLWYIVPNGEKELTINKYHVFETGDPIPKQVELSPFLGTFLLLDGYYVLHVFQTQ